MSDYLNFTVNSESVDGSGVSRLPILDEMIGKFFNGVDFYSDSFTHALKFNSALQAIDWFKSQEIKFTNCHQFLSNEAILTYPDTVQFNGQPKDSLGVIRLVFKEYADNETQVFIYGSREFVDKFQYFKQNRDADIDIIWSYASENGSIKNKVIPLTDADDIYDEYYPYIEGGVDNFLEEYMSHKAPILVFIGEPGTGKTSLLRYLIKKKALQTKVTFDEVVMASDAYYIDYMTDNDTKLMVIEDADLLLSSRDSDQNRVMSKLLNISDGIIKLVRKKIVFTTNLSNVNKIDPALTRPGRCFKVVKFRKLTQAEMLKAAERAGLPPVSAKRDEYSLSEIFNNQIDAPIEKRVGF